MNKIDEILIDIGLAGRELGDDELGKIVSTSKQSLYTLILEEVIDPYRDGFELNLTTPNDYADLKDPDMQEEMSNGYNISARACHDLQQTQRHRLDKLFGRESE
jgi:hypothetical protein